MKKLLFVFLFFVSCLTIHGQKLVVQGEYFWDTDPGVGNGIAVNATDGNFDTALENILQNGINVSTLSSGAHSFNVRVKGQDNSWSAVFKQTIFVQPTQTSLTRSVNVVMGEYFWDTDPGVGNGTPVIALDGNFNTCVEDILSSNISVASLSLGAHSFNVRVKGFDNSWGAVFKQTIFIESTPTAVTRTVRVSQAEYFWDTDPGVGNGTVVLAFDGNFDTPIENIISSNISVATLGLGAHSFNVRVKGFDNSWGALFKQTIFVESTPTMVTRTVRVMQAEYFWDTDPGVGNGTVVLAFDGNFSSPIEDLIKSGILVSSLSVGPHSFNVRVKGYDGSWSALFKQTIAVEATPVAVSRTVKVLQGEYYWDTDPGVGNGTAVLALDGNFNTSIEQVLQNGINVSSLSLGAHSFNVRVKGNDGSWSNVFKQTIYLEGPLVSVSRTVRLLQAEYFWDTDPGVGNGTFILASDGNFDFALENLVKNAIDVSSLSLGAHSFQVRVKGQDNSWSNVFKQTIFIECASPTAASISIASTQNGQCVGSQNVFTASATNGGTNPTFTWKVNGSVVGTNSSTLTISNLNNGDIVTCELVSNSTCASPNSAISNALPVSLSPLVTPTISIASSAGSSICTGTSVTYTATATNTGGSAVYQWKINGVNVGTNSSTFISSTINNGDIITCQMTSSLACTSPTTVTSNAITMSVNSIVTPYISISASSSVICQGTTVTFNATATNGGVSPVYQWKLNGSNVGTNSSSYSNGSLQNGDVVTCILTSTLGCVTSSTATGNSITMSVNPSVSASVSISSSNGTTICQGTTNTFTAVAINGGTFPNYQWKVNGINVGFNQSTYSTASLANGDIVTCQMTSTEACPNPLTSVSNAITMTVNPSTPPTIVISSNQGTSICAGTAVNFTSAITNGGSSPSYQWMLNGSSVGTNSPNYTASSLVQGDIVSCLLTSNATCANGSIGTSNSLSFTVTSNVTPSITIATSTSTICANSTASFTATPTNGGTTPSYQWKVNGFNVGTNSSLFTSNALQNGDIVSCVLTSSLGCVTSSSANSNNITMSVVTSVPSSVSISSSVGTSVCQGTSVVFTATPTNGGTSPSYQWQLNGSNVGTNSSSYTIASLASGDIVSCLMTSNASCASPSTSTSNSITMTVNSTASPTNTISSAQGTSICAGTSVFFTATSTNGGSSPNYQWKINGSNVGPNSAFFNTNTLVQGDIVTCVVTSNATCVNGQTATSNALVFSVTSNVTPSLVITASATTLCSGTTATFTASPTNGGTTPSYQWKVNGINVGTNSATYSTSSLLNGDIVTCVLGSSLSCISSSAVTSNAITMTVNPYTPVSVSISSSVGATICQGTTVNFTATPVNGGTSPSYQWQINGFNVGTNSANYSTSSLSNGNVVSCILTSNAACSNPTSASSNDITMTVNTVSAPTLTISSAQGTSICAGTSVFFTATETNGGSSPNYQWKINGSNVGPNSAFFNTNTLVQGDIVTCVVTSNAACVNGQTAASNALVFSVTTNVTPSVVINASATTLCSGATATFTASPTNGGATPSYQWKVNGINVGANSATYSTSSLLNGDIVTCVLGSSLSCISSSAVTSNAITMTVNPYTPVSVSISSSVGATICQGTTANFTATPVNGGTIPSYQWLINGFNVGANASTYSTNSLFNGDIVSCILTSNAACPNPTSASSNSISMTVNSVSLPTVTITSNQGTSICAGTSVIFTAAETNGGSAPSFQWKVNGINVGSNLAFYSTSSLTQGDIVTCVVTSNANCVNGQTATSNALIFTVTNIATPSISIATSTSTICQGSLASFTATPSFGGSSPSYQWYVNGNLSGSNASVFSSNSLQNNDVVSCVLTSSYACVSATTATSNSISMIVNPSVASSVSIISDNGTTICQGTTTTFSATPINGGASPSYQWQINGSTVGTNSASYSSSSLANGDVITCYMTSSAACPVPSLSVSNSITMFVNTLQTPSINISPSSALPVCPGTVVSFTSTITNGGVAPSYQWKVNGVNAGTNASIFSPSSLSNGDVVSCILTSNAQCLTISSATSNSITFQETTIDASVTQTASTLTANQTGATYQWINCSSMLPIAGQTQQSFTPSVSGNYAVQLTIGSCVDTSACTQMTVVGIAEEKTSPFNVYPNPTTGIIYVSSSTVSPIAVYCLDIAGRIVKTWDISGKESTLNVEGLATGSYYFQIVQDQKMEVFQISIVAQ